MGETLLGLCQQQGGVFTAEQAIGLVGRREFERHVRQRLWVQVFRGVYRPRTQPPCAGTRLRAATLLLGDRTVVGSHHTAAQLHDIAVEQPPETHIIVPRESRIRVSGLVAHRNTIPPQAVSDPDTGLLITSAARTALDLSLLCAPLDTLAILDRTVRHHVRSGGRRGASLDELASEFAEHDNRKGIRQARALLRHVDPGAASPMESRARLRCIEAGLPRAGTQVPVRTPHGIRYVDIGWPQFKVGLEYDSLEHHSGVETVRRDNRRHNQLAEAGWHVIYAGPRQVYDFPEQFTDPIWHAIHSGAMQLPGR